MKTMFAPVYPVMVVEGRDNGKVLVDAYQESCQQGGEGDQGGCTSKEVAQGYEHMWSLSGYCRFKPPGLGWMRLKEGSAKERGVRRRPMTKLLAARFTTNLRNKLQRRGTSSKKAGRLFY